jgi:hypothetical protein
MLGSSYIDRHVSQRLTTTLQTHGGNVRGCYAAKGGSEDLSTRLYQNETPLYSRPTGLLFERAVVFPNRKKSA